MAKQQLTRELGFESALMLGIGTMIGAGIFILPSIAAERAGPAGAISYLIGGLIAIFTALSLSELATGMPKAGGSYYFVNRSLGPFFGTISGIGMWMGLIFACAFYMIGFQFYLSNFISVDTKWIAVGITIALIAMNLYGTKGVGDFQKIIVKLLLLILVIFIIAGCFDLEKDNVENFAPEGWLAVAGLSGLLFIGFMGFEVIATMAEEIKEPEKNLWRAMIASVVIVTFIYIIIFLIAVGGVGKTALAGEETPISYAAREGVLGYPGWTLITIAALLATLSSANASILSASRINFAMGKDRILHPFMQEVNSKFMTPVNSITITGILILVFQVYGEVVVLAEVASFMFLFTFMLIHICVGVLRRTKPDWYNPSFRTPLFPGIQIVGGGACLLLIGQMEFMSKVIGFAMIAIAVLWYKVWSSRKSNVEGEVKKVFEEKKLEEAKKIIHDEGERKRKILVPFTNILYEKIKIRIAAALATKEGAMVRLNVVTIPDQVPIENALPYVGVESIELMDEIKTLDKKVDVEKEYRQTISHGTAATIVKTSKDEDCELILLGRYSTRLPTARIKETLANYVLHKANTDIGVLSMNAECVARVRKRHGLDTGKIRKRAKTSEKGTTGATENATEKETEKGTIKQTVRETVKGMVKIIVNETVKSMVKGKIKGREKPGSVSEAMLRPGTDNLPRLRRILVPYDDNLHTLLALEFARKIGIYEKAKVTLFQVSFKKDLDVKLEKMERIMEDFSVEGFDLRPEILVGRSPAKEIIAASEKYDLIVMGASRKWVLNKFLFGSVPDRVMMEAACPVLFAKKWESKTFSAVKGRVK